MLDFSALTNLWRLLLANFLLNSVVGSFLLFVPWVALHEGGHWRLAAAAAPLVLGPLAYMMGSIEAGRVGDVHHPRTVMMGSALTCAIVCSALLTLTVLTHLPAVPLLLLGGLLTGATTAFTDGAVARTLAAGDDQVAGYAWRGAATQGGTLGGPALALIAYGTVGLAAALVLLAAMGIIALALVASHHYSSHVPFAGELPDRRHGYRILARTASLRAVCIISVLWNVMATMGITLLPILMSDEAHLRPAQGGIITLAGIVAALASPFVIAFARYRLGLLRLAALTMIFEALLVLVFGIVPSALAGVGLYFVFTLLNATCSASQTALRALLNDTTWRASVDIAFRTLSRIGAIAGSLIVLTLVSWSGPYILAWAMVAAVIVLAAATLALRRRMSARASA